jgi:Ca2+-binding RTX toxin-like protein
MRAWLRSLFAPEAASTTRRPASTRLCAEELGRRDVLSATFNPGTGLITVTGTDGADTINIQESLGEPGPFGSYIPGSIKVTVNGRVELNVRDTAVPGLTVDARGGDDTVRNNTSIASTLIGGSGNDQLFGGGGNDVIACGDGNDTAWGSGGNDTLYGDAGNDREYGGAGNDSLYGGRGSDTLYGAGQDTLWGGTGKDTLYRDVGHDVLFGGPVLNITPL